MKKYRIINNMDAWLGNQPANDKTTIIDEAELRRLSQEWEQPIDKLMEDLEEIEEESTMKVTMKTAEDMQKLHYASNTYPVIKADGGEYVQIIDLDTPSYDGRYGKSFWEGYAVRLGDEIDEEGYAPVYTLIWFLDNPDAEDGCDTVNDWEEVDKVVKIGEIDLETGRIV